jgi:phosphonate transport system substrate-binding protein
MKTRHYIASVIALALIISWPQKVVCENEILIGLIPEENIFNQMDRHRPLSAYLSKKIGTPVRFTILSRYGDVMDRFASRKMDGAFFGVFTGVLAMEKINAEPVARPVNLDGSSTVQSYIFVRNNSGIRNVQDMAGKRIIFVDRATVTGYLFALSYFREHGIVNLNTYFRDVSFTGSHGSTIYAVLDGRADVGTVRSKIFQMLTAKDHTIREELAIIARSQEFPDTTFFLRKDLPQFIRSQIKAALLGMDRDPEGVEVLKKLEAKKFTEAKKEDFEPFYDVARKAGISLKTYRYK